MPIDIYDIPDRPLDPPEGEEPELTPEQIRRRNLIADLGYTIRHIDVHNSFDKRDLIDLLRRAKSYIVNVEVSDE